MIIVARVRAAATCIAVIVALATSTRALAAQAPGPVLHWTAAPVTAHWKGAPVADSVRIPETYWQEGALIGGGLMGAFVGALAVAMCGYDSPCRHPMVPAIEGFAIGGMLGAGIGALIGGQFPRHGAH